MASPLWLVTELDHDVPVRHTAWTREGDARAHFIERTSKHIPSLDRAFDELGDHPDPATARTIIDAATGAAIRIVTVQLDPDGT